MPKHTLSGLPDEVLYCILYSTPPRSTTALEQTASRFKDVTNSPLLWRFYCRTYFRYWDRRHDISRKFASPAVFVDWKKLYAIRHRIDIATTATLNGILANQTGRIEKFHNIVSFGYDVKDTLLRHARVGSDQEDHLARRYVSRRALHTFASWYVTMRIQS